MRERPILFSGSMVQAILAGRKTVTRRLLKEQPQSAARGLYVDRYNKSERWAFWLPDGRMDAPRTFACRYGEPGDRLWVKETWRPEVAHSHGMDACDCADVCVTYVADGAVRFVDDRRIPAEWTLPKAAARGNVSPLHMPRWASRLTLEVVSVRVERLHDITEEDARAEGVRPVDDPFQEGRELWECHEAKCVREGGCAGVLSALESFATLWRSINGAESWDSNPWVWRVEFKRVGAAS